MSEPNYRVFTVDLTSARDRVQLVKHDKQIKTVALLVLPTAADIDIHFGEQGDAIPLRNQGMNAYLNEPANEGLFISNTAQAGVEAVLMVSFESGRGRGATPQIAG